MYRSHWRLVRWLWCSNIFYHSKWIVVWWCRWKLHGLKVRCRFRKGRWRRFPIMFMPLQLPMIVFMPMIVTMRMLVDMAQIWFRDRLRMQTSIRTFLSHGPWCIRSLPTRRVWMGMPMMAMAVCDGRRWQHIWRGHSRLTSTYSEIRAVKLVWFPSIPAYVYPTLLPTKLGSPVAEVSLFLWAREWWQTMVQCFVRVSGCVLL